MPQTTRPAKQKSQTINTSFLETFMSYLGPYLDVAQDRPRSVRIVEHLLEPLHCQLPRIRRLGQQKRRALDVGVRTPFKFNQLDVSVRVDML